MKTKMIGHNDGKAMAIYNSLSLLPALVIACAISLLCIVPIVLFRIYWLLFIFIAPAILTFVIFLNFALIGYHNKVYLHGIKTEHTFELSNGILYKDDKEIKRTKNIKIRKFKKFLFLELEKSYYRIENNEYTLGSRDTFLASFTIDRKHHVTFLNKQ